MRRRKTSGIRVPGQSAERPRGWWWQLILVAVVAAGIGFGIGYLLVI